MGRSFLKWRNFACFPMIVILPVSLPADDTGAAMLRSNGGVLVNKAPAPALLALFRDDLIETPKEVVARIEMTGSMADVSSETMIQFEGDELVLDHGSVSVNTSRVLRVRVGCITVAPVNSDWTRYDVTDMNGKVTVSASKSDVYIDSRSANSQQAKQPSHSDRMIVREGEQKSREDKCGGRPMKESTRLAGRGAIMNSPYAVAIGASGIVGVTCWVLCASDNPASPSVP